LYRVLVDGTTIVHIEIPRDPKKGEVVFEKWSVKEYLNGPETRPKGIYRRKFLMALKLAGGRAASVASVGRISEA
jgi:hypothetical protein